MKHIAFLLPLFICYCQYSGANNTNISNGLNGIDNVSSVTSQTPLQRPAPTPEVKFDLKVNIYEDSKFASSYLYHKGVLQTVVYAAEQSDDVEIEDDSDSDFVERIDASNKTSYEYLKSKKIDIPYPELIYEQIRDIVTIFPAYYETFADGDSDVKRSVNVNGAYKTFKVDGLAKSFKFYPSQINITEQALIHSYELTLKKNQLFKEIYRYNNNEPDSTGSNSEGILTREYTYQNNRLIRLLTTSTVGAETTVKEIKYEYEFLSK